MDYKGHESFCGFTLQHMNHTKVSLKKTLSSQGKPKVLQAKKKFLATRPKKGPEG
jgi:hypothetical protein